MDFYDHAADTAILLDIRPIVVAYIHVRTLDWFLSGRSIPVAIPSRTIVPPSLRNSPLTITALQPLVIPPIVIIVPTFNSPVGPILRNFIQLAFLSFFSFSFSFRAFYTFGTFLANGTSVDLEGSCKLLLQIEVLDRDGNVKPAVIPLVMVGRTTYLQRKSQHEVRDLSFWHDIPWIRVVPYEGNDEPSMFLRWLRIVFQRGTQFVP